MNLHDFLPYSTYSFVANLPTKSVHAARNSMPRSNNSIWPKNLYSRTLVKNRSQKALCIIGYE